MAEITTEAPPPYPGLPCVNRFEAPPPYSHIYQQVSVHQSQSISNELFEPPPPVTRQTTSQSRRQLNENHRRMLPLATIRVCRPPVRSAPPSYMEVIANGRHVDLVDIELNDTSVRCPPVLGPNHCQGLTAEGLCPHCMKEITTKTTYYPGALVCWMYFVLCLIVGPILAILVCFIPKLHNVYHKCPECRKTIHIYKRRIADRKEWCRIFNCP